MRTIEEVTASRCRKGIVSTLKSFIFLSISVHFILIHIANLVVLSCTDVGKVFCGEFKATGLN